MDFFPGFVDSGFDTTDILAEPPSLTQTTSIRLFFLRPLEAPE